MTRRQALRQLAREAGIQLAYRDLAGQRQVASDEALLAVLRALGFLIHTPEEAPAVLAEWRQARLARRCEPVQVWRVGRGAPRLQLVLPAFQEGRFELVVQREDGAVLDLRPAERRWSQDQAGQSTTALPAIRVDLALPHELPLGYHAVTIRCPDGQEARTLLVVRPPTVALPGALGIERTWGNFLPLYALWRDEPGDGATYRRLGEFVAWTRERGGEFVGTLPLLPTFLGERPYDPSPYAPVSRLFWSEFFVDPGWSPFPDLVRAGRLVVSGDEQGNRFVEYRATWRERFQALAVLAREAARHERVRSEVEAWLAERPLVLAYARFRAAVDQGERLPSPRPDRGQDQRLDEAAWIYAVAQWLANQQLAAVGKERLYLDLPLGVHPEGFDVWYWPELFAQGASAGAPPDPFFAGGQVWGFPPLHPERIREDGYRYLRAVLAHHLRAARLLRIDHVMGFHRLYWVPAGASGREGVYVRYPAEEFYAILAIESQRAGCAVVGEDLGTVPWAVRRAMRRNGLLRMYVLPFERRDGRFTEPPPDVVASLVTHDLPPFAALWDEWGPEIQEAVLGWLAERGSRAALESDRRAAALLGLLRFLAESPAAVVAVNVEDLWFEREPQNRPGTGLEMPNWRRLARLGSASFGRDPFVTRALAIVETARKGGAG
ncbi:4-alpha-glucanotransferase [Thermomicrobium sp.]